MWVWGLNSEEFIGRFFPIEAAIQQHFCRVLSIWDPSPGWWHCFGAGGLPGGAGLQEWEPSNDSFPEFAAAATAFDWVLHQAFHIGEEIVQFSQAFQEVPLEAKRYNSAETFFAIFG